MTKPTHAIGSVYKNKKGQSYRIEAFLGPEKVGMYRVKFLATGYVTEVRSNAMNKGNVKDRSTGKSVGFIGEGAYNSTHPAYYVWKNMIARCYESTHPNFYLYGAKGVTVCSEWHNYQNFAKWYDCNVVQGRHLDKDILSSKQKIYSPSTCKFVTPRKNAQTARGKTYTFKSPEGDILIIEDLAKFCSKHSLNRQMFYDLAAQRKTQYKGYTHYVCPTDLFQ